MKTLKIIGPGAGLTKEKRHFLLPVVLASRVPKHTPKSVCHSAKQNIPGCTWGNNMLNRCVLNTHIIHLLA